MAKKLIPVAIAYDFDGTLAPGNMQEHSFIPGIGINNPNEFWQESKAYAKKNDMDEILSYMYLMLEKARSSHEPIHEERFKEHGQEITFFDGVEEWFDRINQYAKSKGISLKHYIISSGLREMINGTSIAKHFDYVFASGFAYNHNGIADWPALAVNYTSKTQFLFRINKGSINSYDNSMINKYMPEDERPMPFKDMIYIGDGETDIPAMKMVKINGGHAIAVYNPNQRKTSKRKSGKETALELIDQDRANFVSPADYSENKSLDIIVKTIIDKIALDHNLKELSQKS